MNPRRSRRRTGAVRVTARQVAHWGARMRTDDWRGYCGFVIERNGRKIGFAGDTARTNFRPLGERERHRSAGDADRGLQSLGHEPLQPRGGGGDGGRSAGAVAAADPSCHVSIERGADGRADRAVPRRAQGYAGDGWRRRKLGRRFGLGGEGGVGRMVRERTITPLRALLGDALRRSAGAKPRRSVCACRFPTKLP